MGFFCLISQGQVEASVRLEASVPEDAEFYVAVRGSTLTHVTTAKRGVDGLTLRFTAPGTLTPGSIPILSFSSHCSTLVHLDFLCSPQAMFSLKSPPSHPTVTQRSGSSPAGGKRLCSTAGMLPRRLPSAREQPASSGFPLGAPRKP